MLQQQVTTAGSAAPNYSRPRAELPQKQEGAEKIGCSAAGAGIVTQSTFIACKTRNSRADIETLTPTLQGLARWRKATFENLQPPLAAAPEPGKRRSVRARAGTQFFTPTLGGPAKHAR